jgi:hypothetical protein
MDTDKHQQIQNLIGRLDAEIQLARECSLSCAAQLLAMARLDLELALHSISVDELRQVTSRVDTALSRPVRSEPNGDRTPLSKRKVRRAVRVGSRW